jgi:hypothetical protein
MSRSAERALPDKIQVLITIKASAVALFKCAPLENSLHFELLHTCHQQQQHGKPHRQRPTQHLQYT